MNIHDFVKAAYRTTSNSINLIASENVTSTYVKMMLATDFAHRYIIPPRNKRPHEIWDYPNQEINYKMYDYVSSLACTLFNGDFADLRPLSGNQLAFSVISSALTKKYTLFSLGSQNGGHFATGKIAEFHGRAANPIPFEKNSPSLDLNVIHAFSRKHGPIFFISMPAWYSSLLI